MTEAADGCWACSCGRHWPLAQLAEDCEAKHQTEEER